MRCRQIRTAMTRLVLSVVLMLSVVTPSSAETMAEAAQPLRKLSRGLGNAVGGIFALPVTIADVGEQEGPVAGMTWGLFIGLGAAVTRMLVGVAEVATFPLPLPQVGYGPLLLPEFLFQPESS